MPSLEGPSGAFELHEWNAPVAVRRRPLRGQIKLRSVCTIAHS